MLSLELANTPIMAISLPSIWQVVALLTKKRKQGGLLPEPIPKSKKHELVYSEIFFHEMHCTDNVNFLSFHKKNFEACIECPRMGLVLHVKV